MEPVLVWDCGRHHSHASQSQALECIARAELIRKTDAMAYDGDNLRKRAARRSQDLQKRYAADDLYMCTLR